jgi:plastocyanin
MTQIMNRFTSVAIGAAVASVAAIATAAATRSAPIEGTATGRVKFEGKKPDLKPLAITPEQSKGCCADGKTVDAKDPSMVIGEGDGIANVVITVDVDGATVKAPAEPLHIDQKECHFEPHILVAPVGAKVGFLNSDGVSHNVHTYASKNDSFNKTIAPGSKEEQVLAKGDKIEVKCDIHPWMNGWIYVTETPYYAVTKADGSFSIEGLKPGTYKAEAWHEKLGKKKLEIVVKEDGTCAPVDVVMGEKKKK